MITLIIVVLTLCLLSLHIIEFNVKSIIVYHYEVNIQLLNGQFSQIIIFFFF